MKAGYIKKWVYNVRKLHRPRMSDAIDDGTSISVLRSTHDTLYCSISLYWEQWSCKTACIAICSSLI